MSARERNLISLQIGLALAALLVGTLLGPFQALEHSKINLYPFLKPLISNYYQGLTIHGVLNSLVFTTLFITAFHSVCIIKGLKRRLRWFWLAAAGLAFMTAGLIVAAITIFSNQATVLYTYYPPMQATPWFYIGLTALIAGSWMIGWSQLGTLVQWRKENPGVRTPLIAMGSSVNAILWQLSTLGIAIQMFVLVIPWALSWVPATDALLSRVLFWFTGHPLVYFWLLPAYVSWYGLLPRQVGGKLFSDPLARLSFWGFLILSTPVGFHHQFTDPGVPVAWKYIHTLLTFLVILPSFMTAFTVIASLERAGRKSGGKGLLGWVLRLPWKDPSVSAQLLSGLVFFFGGIGGIINASASLNLVIHNTTWVPGHFHLTVATAATLTFMGISFWLIPHLTHKKLKYPKFALASAWTWFFGMIVFSFGMHWLGLLGAPRRVPLATAAYDDVSWHLPEVLTGIGGAILFVAAALYFISIIATFVSKGRQADPVEMPIAEAEIDPSHTPQWLDQWTPWIVLAVILVIIGYGPILVQMFGNLSLVSPGFKVW